MLLLSDHIRIPRADNTPDPWAALDPPLVAAPPSGLSRFGLACTALVMLIPLGMAAWATAAALIQGR